MRLRRKALPAPSVTVTRPAVAHPALKGPDISAQGTRSGSRVRALSPPPPFGCHRCHRVAGQRLKGWRLKNRNPPVLGGTAYMIGRYGVAPEESNQSLRSPQPASSITDERTSLSIRSPFYSRPTTHCAAPLAQKSSQLQMLARCRACTEPAASKLKEVTFTAPCATQGPPVTIATTRVLDHRQIAPCLLLHLLHGGENRVSLVGPLQRYALPGWQTSWRSIPRRPRGCLVRLNITEVRGVASFCARHATIRWIFGHSLTINASRILREGLIR